MSDATDRELLARYANGGDREAFNLLVRRHVDMVHAAARRQAPQAADDVVQAVFLLLAQKAGKISGNTLVVGWLYRVARYCCANLVKMENRRRRYEREAAAMAIQATDPSREKLLPLLDEAMNELGRSERDAVLLRYLEAKSLEETGRQLGISTDAAIKRIGRGLERLRQYFARQGYAVGAAALVALAAAEAAKAAPVNAAARVQTALAATGPLTGAPTVVSLMRQGRTMIRLARIKLLATAATLCVILPALAMLIVAQVLHPSTNNKGPAQNAPVAQAVAADHTLTLTIKDKQTGQPLADTPVIVYFDNDKSPQYTDTAGKLLIEFPSDKLKYFCLRVARSGYSPVRVEWLSQTAPDPTPPTYILALGKGTTIGGIVRDDKGNAIDGAKVFLIVGNASTDSHEQADIWDVQVRTDEQGRWHYDLAPEKPTSISVRLEHPGYVSDNFYDDTAHSDKPEIYRALDHVLIMHKGLAVVGRVSDEAGNPIAGAWVKQGDDRWGSQGAPQTKTNARGEFKFPQVNPGKMTLTVQAKGYAPDLKEVVVGDDAGLVEFRLAQGQTLRARVVDAQGFPIAEAMIFADTWRTKRSIDWRSKTDRQGRFVWDNAPADAVTFHILKEGYMSDRNAVLTATPAEQTVTLRPPIVIHGSVVDVQTGRAVPSFQLFLGRRYKDRYPDLNPDSWNREETGKFTDGKYEMTFTEPGDPTALGLLRVEADGYAPLVSRPIKPDEGIDAPIQLDFKLQVAADIRFVVLGPDGKVAADAKATLAIKGRYVEVSDGRFGRNTLRESAIVAANGDGIISFVPEQEGNAVLVIVAEAGYAALPLEHLKRQSDKEIKLEPWARIEATFKVGSKPFAGEPVHATAAMKFKHDDAPFAFEGNGTTDQAGRVVFPKMPAGGGYVQDFRPNPYGEWGGAVRGIYDVKGGQTLQLRVGGTGRPVVGRALVSGDYQGKANWITHASGEIAPADPLSAEQRPPALPYPADWSRMSFDARRAWWQGFDAITFRQESQDVAWRIPWVRSRKILFDADGRFHANDLSAGKYKLNLYLQPDAGGSDAAVDGYKVLTVEQDIEIAPIPGGQTDEPLDVGSLTLKPRAPKQPEPPPATLPAPEPGSPADVDQRYWTAVETGDAQVALACIDASHPAAESYVHYCAQLAAGCHRAADAAVAALGLAKAQQLGRRLHLPVPGADYLSPTQFKFTWQINGDMAVPFGPEAHGIGQTMVRLDGQWKLNAGEWFVSMGDDGDLTTMGEQFAKEVARFDKLTDALKAGKVTTADEAAAILQAP